MTNYDLQLWGMFLMGMVASACLFLFVQMIVSVLYRPYKHKNDEIYQETDISDNAEDGRAKWVKESQIPTIFEQVLLQLEPHQQREFAKSVLELSDFGQGTIIRMKSKSKLDIYLNANKTGKNSSSELLNFIKNDYEKNGKYLVEMLNNLQDRVSKYLFLDDNLHQNVDSE